MGQENLENTNVPNSEALPEVKPRGDVEYVDHKGMVHFFESEELKRVFIEEENDPANKE